MKVVNTTGTPRDVHVEISGIATLQSKGEAITLSANAPEETNSLTEPVKIIPVETIETGFSPNFIRTFPAYSITVLKLKAK